MIKHSFLFFITALLFLNLALAQKKDRSNKATTFKFDFGSGKTEAGYIKILSETKYTDEKGYGIDLETSATENKKVGKNPSTDGYLTSDKPFYFSVKIPEGNYHVKVVLGDDFARADLVVRTESHRMMVNRIQTDNGKHKTVEFTVHIRDSVIRGGKYDKVNLKPREYENLMWDDKITLEFNGLSPKINVVEICPENNKVTTLFLTGDSTVVDQSNEPWASWGQMIPAFFKPGQVAVANYAESGETISSSIAQHRLDKVYSLLKAGDYVFIEFGHNDQKQKGKDAGAFKNYKKYLEIVIAEIKQRGGIPVLVTPVQRRKFDENGKIVATLGDYPEAVRGTAKEQNVALIDLNAMSKIMYEALGPKESINAFVHYPANMFPGKDKPLADNTHFRPYGAYEIAKLVVKGIRDSQLKLALSILDDIPEIDPAKPGTFESFYWPLSPLKEVVKPDGN
ncbi:rhamnogalacturonan acetylesterase [Flavobacterium sp. HJJ]|uniref:rhamnogalacturonan acetylesterase n=1 Tax=Flavobacterium sp. HJJ TaxID=2783792 RepID=UPI00188A037E|nr:rhamnogalacturonan acetylesterase [Flavobacterium sp. HJJ]MBF4473017.1 rhamnogalacturonan acetylesterase [Flavobacterium sp. HJJ]